MSWTDLQSQVAEEFAGLTPDLSEPWLSGSACRRLMAEELAEWWSGARDRYPRGARDAHADRFNRDNYAIAVALLFAGRRP